MKVVDWISYEAAAGRPRPIGGWGGFFEPGMRWKDFRQAFRKKEWKKEGRYYKALRREILAKQIRAGGAWHQHGPDGVPLFEDGSVALFSFRSWGDLMAAIWSSEEERDYSYMDFYMDAPCEPLIKRS